MSPGILDPMNVAVVVAAVVAVAVVAVVDLFVFVVVVEDVFAERVLAVALHVSLTEVVELPLV